ncbi:MAG: mRNA surveillance protein pelota [Thermoplasmatota archaeon]|nr:mRNA surveillance protein pelota [Halobacteriales archaeon]
MRLLNKDVHEGFLHLRLDTLDDLWAVRNLVQDGDQVTADTVRTADMATGGDDRLREGKAEKRRMRLTVRAEQVEWHEFDDHLRVLGPITAGPQDLGRHHTLILRADGADVQVRKPGPLQGWQLRIVEDAVAATEAPRVLLLAIDDSEAQFALLKSYGLQLLGSLPSGGQGKRHPGAEEAKRAFYGEALKSLKVFRPDPKTPLVVVGPGWWRDEFLEFVRARDPAQAAAVASEGTAQGGRAGLQEALRRGVVERVSQGHRVQKETALVEELLARIAKGDGTAAYGPDDVAAAVQAGAAETVLAADAEVRSGRFDAVLKAAESARAHVAVVATTHQAGEQLHRMGGLAALLRFPLV